MALYWDAVSVLEGIKDQGSLKSRIYGLKADFRSKPAHVYALIIETAKYDTFLKEVIENAGILAHEPKVCLLSFRPPRVCAD
jgi:25S rRNA (cytosine2278-C5)-methyltransferase